jgi:hypothetical protein
MEPGFDFTTPEVLNWEIEAIWAAIEKNELLITVHARNELNLDALTEDDLFDAIFFYDEAYKDLPSNTAGRAAGINFHRHFQNVVIRVKVGWRETYYVAVTVMSN